MDVSLDLPGPDLLDRDLSSLRKSSGFSHAFETLAGHTVRCNSRFNPKTLKIDKPNAWLEMGDATLTA